MTATVPPAAPESAAGAKRSRRAWSLQAKLMSAIIGMVALILAVIALSTSVILTQVLQGNLETQVQSLVR